ncbi:MAG: hypothetical protein IPI42_06695 [Saprospiraceae bacterium]|nr:hypothetical protein [Candidatus Parvibacillus calidus]
MQLPEMQDPAGDDVVAAEYFKSQSDLTTPENVKLLASFAMKPHRPTTIRGRKIKRCRRAIRDRTS